jgi:hypothetical protein
VAEQQYAVQFNDGIRNPGETESFKQYLARGVRKAACEAVICAVIINGDEAVEGRDGERGVAHYLRNGADVAIERLNRCGGQKVLHIC